MPIPPSTVEDAQILLGGALRDRRAMLGLTLAEVARAAGISQSYLSDCERGRKLPSLPILLSLARALDVLMTDLLQDLYPFGTQRRPRRVRPPVDGRLSEPD